MTGPWATSPTAGPTSRRTALRGARSLKLRQQVGAFDVGAEFPGLPADASLLDGAAGCGAIIPSSRPSPPIGLRGERRRAASALLASRMYSGRRAAPGLLNCESDEVVFDPSATALVVHVARARAGLVEGQRRAFDRGGPRLQELVRHRRDTNSRRPTTTATSSPGSSRRSGRAVTYDT